MSNKPKPQAPANREVPDGHIPAEPKPIEVVAGKKSVGPIVALHDNALVGQTTFAAGTVLAHVAPVAGVTLEQLCSAILHGKAGVRPENE